MNNDKTKKNFSLAKDPSKSSKPIVIKNVKKSP